VRGDQGVKSSVCVCVCVSGSWVCAGVSGVCGTAKNWENTSHAVGRLFVAISGEFLLTFGEGPLGGCLGGVLRLDRATTSEVHSLCRLVFGCL
jgi:hypothetical protein